MNAFTALAVVSAVVLLGGLYGLVIVALNRLAKREAARLLGRLSGLPALVAPFGCDDCSVEDGEPHRYAGCPGNIRQIERDLALIPREDS